VTILEYFEQGHFETWKEDKKVFVSEGSEAQSRTYLSKAES